MKKVLDWIITVGLIGMIILMIVFFPKVMRTVDDRLQQDEMMVRKTIECRLNEELEEHWYNPFYTVSGGTDWFTVDDIEVKYTYNIKNGSYTYYYEMETTINGILNRTVDTIMKVIEE